MANTKSLTEGTPWKLLLSFSVPILIGRIFQLLYSLMDTKVVGAALGELALASVGSVSNLAILLTGFANGLTIGFSIAMSYQFGRKDEEGVRKAYAGNLLLSIIIMLSVTIVMMIFLHPLMELLRVPQEQMEMAVAYIRILILGFSAAVLYNMCANALRALGDSITPLMFLIVASLLNVALDYLFVLGFHMGVAGAAYATVVSQAVSVVLCFIRIRRKFPILHLHKSDWKLERALAVDMLKSGMSMAFMSCLVSFGTLALQTAINQMGTDVIVAHVATRKVFEIFMLPSFVLASAITTFSGQNYGAGRLDRIGQGLKSALLIGLVWSIIGTILIWMTSGYLIQFIASTANPEVIRWGSIYINVNFPFSFICICVCVLRNCMQGFGDRVIPVMSSIIELIGKFVFALVLTPIFFYWGVIWAEPCVWAAMVVPLIIKTRKTLRSAAAEENKTTDASVSDG